MCKIVSDPGIRKPDVIRAGPEEYEVSFIWEEEKLWTIVDRREDEAELPSLGQAAA